jgi:CheY-like chemotaxis protein
MQQYSYDGLEAFGEDRGTFCPPSAVASETFDTDAFDDAALTREIAERADGRPVVWFVDDERANREWFRDHHRERFATVTFSSHANFRRALARGLPGDAFVTDIFFPATPVASEAQAAELLAVYDAISKCEVQNLRELWAEQRRHWSLDGFQVARDGATQQPPVPVFLFSRKAPFLLGVEDYVSEPRAVANSYWLTEKVAPDSPVEISQTAARVQATRILAVLDRRSAVAAAATDASRN